MMSGRISSQIVDAGRRHYLHVGHLDRQDGVYLHQDILPQNVQALLEHTSSTHERLPGLCRLHSRITSEHKYPFGSETRSALRGHVETSNVRMSLEYMSPIETHSLYAPDCISAPGNMKTEIRELKEMSAEVDLKESPKLFIHSVSDLHVDESENATIVENFPSHKDTPGEIHVLLCAGDISAYMDSITGTLQLLLTKFDHVFFVCGNNELRLKKPDRKKFKNSLEKFERIIEVVEALGVKTKPEVVCGVLIVPLFSWYAYAFGVDPCPEDEKEREYTGHWLDFHQCAWPNGMDSVSTGVCEFFAEYNAKQIEAHIVPEESKHEAVVTFSHFLPRRELTPIFSRYFLNPSIVHVMGFAGLDEQLRGLQSTIHVYGHSHKNSSDSIDGVVYIQNALGHVEERGTLWRPSKSYAPKIIYPSS